MSFFHQFMNTNINLNVSDIFWIKKFYPLLTYYQNENKIIGDISFYRHDTFNDIGTMRINDTYRVSIELISKPPSILPIVKEISGKIEKIAIKLNKSLKDLHINDDSSICLTIYEKEKDFFPNGFNITIFFKDILEGIYIG